MLRARPVRHLLRCLALGLWLTAGVLATSRAQGPATPAKAANPGGPSWASLSPAQQQALAPLQRDWAGIDAERKSKWLQVASRFHSMPEADRRRVQQRMAEWARLTPDERGRARLQFQQARQLPAEDRQSRWEAYRALPEDKRRELASRAHPAAASASQPASAAGIGAPQTKRNVVLPTPPAPPKAVTPIIVQPKPGATTTLLSQQAAPPAHQQSGLPKIVASEGFVQPKTLLPKRGPQGAGVRQAPAASAPTK